MALVIWPLVVAPLLYLPLIFYLQRRMIEGVHLPLVCLAALGLAEGLLPAVQRSRLAGWLVRRRSTRPRMVRLVEGLTLAMTTPSTWYLLASLTLAAAAGHGALFVSRAEAAAIDRLSARASPTDTVLASYEISGYIPARSGQRVFWGHWAESIHLEEKRAAAEAFFSADPTFDRADFLRRHGIVYVFYGPRERAAGGFPTAAPYLEPVLQEGEVTVYRVLLEADR